MFVVVIELLGFLYGFGIVGVYLCVVVLECFY